KVVQDTELKEASKAIGATVGNLLFGTTALPVVDPDYQRYPRRVAFARYTTAGTNKDKLYLDDTKLPVALGINTTVGCYSYSSGASDPIVKLPTTVNGGANVAVCQGQQTTLTATGTATSYVWSPVVTNGVAFTPAATGNYIVTGTGSNGCTKRDTVLVTVNSLPIVSAGLDQTVCSGSSVTLSGSGALTYTWNNGISNGTPFTASATTTYTVTGTDGNNCQNTDQAVVTVNALPTVSAGLDQAICSGASTTLNGSGASSYSWNNGVINGTSFTPSGTTTYTVTGTDGNGCQNTDQVVVTVNALPTVSAGLDQTVCSGTTVTLAGSGASSYSWNNGITNNTAFTASATTTFT
ncbi:MAG: hypothetical protein ACOVOV_12565, partial [Dolichospermum sp.]